MRGFVILLLFYGAGWSASHWLHLPIPGNMLGMLLLAVCLLTGMVKWEWVEAASQFLLRHMLLFFIPVLVGVVPFAGLLWTNGMPVGIALLIGAPLAMLMAGLIVQTQVNRQQRLQEEKGRAERELAERSESHA